MRLLACLAAALLAAACTPAMPPEVPTVPLPPAAPAPQPDAPPTPAPPPKPQAAARPTGVPGTSIRFAGGAGTSVKDAIVIEGAHGESDGVPSEYQYLTMLIGPRNTAWRMVKQALLNEGGRKYDALDVVVQGKTVTYYFDITDYFGK